MTENMLTEFLFLKGSGNKISNKRVVFNKSDGHVFLDGILVMKLKPNQTSYRFLEKLYDNY